MKGLAILALTLATATVAAQDMRVLVPSSEAEDGSMTWFVRRDRMATDGGLLSFWVYTYAKKPMPVYTNQAKPVYLSTISQWSTNCASGTVAYGETNYYDDKGNVVAVNPGSPYYYKRPMPDSHADRASTVACFYATTK